MAERSPWVGIRTGSPAPAKPKPKAIQRRTATDQRVMETAEVVAGNKGQTGDHAVRKRELEALQGGVKRALRDTTILTQGELALQISQVYSAINAESQALSNAFNTSFDQAEARTDALIATVNASIAQMGTEVDADLATLRQDAEDAVEDLRAAIAADFSVTIPRVGDVEEAIQAIASRVSWLATIADRTRGLIADAGIYVDPASGRVLIEGLSRVDEKVTEATIRVDAMEGEIALRVTQADVDLAIATAQLDPAQLPILTGLTGRITDLETGLDAAEAAITQRATVIDFNNLETTVSQASIRIDALEGEITQKVTNTDFSLLETRVSSAETSLQAIDGASFTLQLTDIRNRVTDAEWLTDATLADITQLHRESMDRKGDAAIIRQEYHALVDDERVARATMRTELGAAIDAATATIVLEQQARASADEALATQITGLQASVAGVNAALTTESAARVAADSALAGQITTIAATVAENTAQITAESVARVNADASFAAQITGLSASLDATNSNISTNYYTRAQTDSAISAVQTALQSQIAGVATTANNANTLATAVQSNLNTNFYTKAQTDQALSALETELSSAISLVQTDASGAATLAGQIQANLATNYYTRTQTDQAISAVQTTLQSSINEVQTTADGKGRVFFQNTAPPLNERLPQNLWIDTTGGANTPRRWNETAWVAVTDRAATDAAALAQSVQATLNNNHYTRAQTDQAIASSIATLQAQLNTTNATLQNSYYTIAQTNSAIATAQTSLQTQINGLSTSLTVLQEATDGIEAVYGVRVNNNGHVSGFGLISSLRDGQPTSDFIVSDASLRLVNSQGQGNFTPFAVFPTGRWVDGVFVPAGVHAQNLFVTRANIADAAINSAKIADASVETLKIGPNAVTVPVAEERWDTIVGQGQWSTGVSSVGFTLPIASRVVMLWTGVNNYTPYQQQAVGVRFVHNGTWVIASRLTNSGISGLATDWPTFSTSVVLAAGSHWIQVDWWGGNSNLRLGQRSLFVMGAMR